MAKAFFNYLVKNKASATSAGTKPSSQVNPIVVEAMFEVGIDIRNQVPKALTLEMLKSADRVITMGCGVEEDRAGVLVEYGPTSQLFTNPRDKRTEDYITGRFG